MNVRLLFGKPLPRALYRVKAASILSWMPVFLLVAGTGLMSWLVMRLLRRAKTEMEQMVFY
jgi:hypothetical protein